MGPPTFPLRAVAALFLERQHLDRPRGRRLTAATLRRFVEDAGGLQLDTINVVERAHHLTLWSRFGPYDRRAFDRLVYRRRVLFEYWSHAACLVPATHFPQWRRAMLDYGLHHTGGWLRKNARMVRAVEEAIAANGPLGNADFEHRRAPGDRSGWWSWKPATHALHYLWMKGRTLIHSRPHFQKRFDLAERLMPEAMAVAPPSTDEFRRWHLGLSLHAMGAATETDLRMYLTFPRMGVAERRRTLRHMLESGEVVEIRVEEPGARNSSTRWLALAADLPALERAARRRAPSRGSTLLSPFDSLLWHRERTRRLFGYDYRIEVYTPGEKRVHGYYSLPIFHDGQLIGRLDPKTHRAERRLEIRNLHFEPWFERGDPPPAARWSGFDRDQALAGLADSLRSLASFVGADALSWRSVPRRGLAAAVRKLL